MINANELRPGTAYLEGENLYQVITFSNSKTARAGAVISCKVRNLRTGSIISVTYGGTNKFKPAYIDKSKMQFIYQDGNDYVFMDNSSFEQFSINVKKLKWESNFLIEGANVEVKSFNGEILGIELPNNISLEVIESDPAVKGNTVTTALKSAIVATGLQVQVPLFINVGDKIDISTIDATYKGRSK